MLEPARILVIEDEPAIADTLVYALRTEGFAPHWCANGHEGLAAFTAANRAMGGADSGGFALVILDVGLPDVSGFEVCRQLRTCSTVPVLFLTARSSEIDRVVGLEIGGDDYVTKPFSPREVSARVRAILRRTATVTVAPTHTEPPTASPTETALASVAETAVVPAKSERPRLKSTPLGYTFPEPVVLLVDAEAKMATWGGVELELTRYEFRLLAVLHGRSGRVWSRDELMQRVWEDPGASLDRTVDAHIKTLRAKLRAAAPEAADPIHTHRGEGYSLRLVS